MADWIGVDVSKRSYAAFIGVQRDADRKPGTRQDPVVRMMMERLGDGSPLIGAVTLETMLLRRFGVEITAEVMAKVLDKVENAERVRRAITAPTAVEPKRRAPRGRFRYVDVTGSVVYYMRIGNRVKIGTSTNLSERLRAINPEELMAVESGDHDKERVRHAQFAELHTHGEWFRLEGALVEHIAAIRKVTR